MRTQGTHYPFFSIAFLCLITGFSSALVFDSRNQTYSGLTSYEFQNLIDLLMDEKQSRHQLEAKVLALEQKLDDTKVEIGRQIELCEHKVNTSRDALEKLGNSSESEMASLRQAFNKEKTNRHYLQQAFTRLVNDFQNLTAVNKNLLARNGKLEEEFIALSNQTEIRIESSEAVIKEVNQSLSTDMVNLRNKPMVAFTARNKNEYVNGALTFSVMITSVGSGYDQATGLFTCHTPGLYLVSMTLQYEKQSSIICDISKNGRNTYIEVDAGGIHPQQPYTQTAVFHLKTGDTVKVGPCVNPNNIGEESSFTVVMLQPEF